MSLYSPNFDSLRKARGDEAVVVAVSGREQGGVCHQGRHPRRWGCAQRLEDALLLAPWGPRGGQILFHASFLQMPGR